MIPCYVFDLDGTLANCAHRMHHIRGAAKDWYAFYAEVGKDAPISHIVEIARTLGIFSNKHVVYSTGRDESARRDTGIWLDNQHLPRGPLYMRPSGNFRPDFEIKSTHLVQMRADGFNPVAAFEDRSAIAKMWREAGVPCLLVSEDTY